MSEDGRTRNVTFKLSKYYNNIYCIMALFSCILLISFWCGVMYASQALSVHPSITPATQKANGESSIEAERHEGVKSAKFTLRKENDEKFEDVTTNKILIALHGDKVWNKYDKWEKKDWYKCPAMYRNCHITNEPNSLSDSDEAIVYNSMDMPSSSHVSAMKGKNIKRIFLSGKTPLETKFTSSDYDDFFSHTITYKGNSDIRIPYWPNDGLLPAMYRPKVGTQVNSEDLLDLEEENQKYFDWYGKENFLGYVMQNCSSSNYANMFVAKLRDEGALKVYGNSDRCLKNAPIKNAEKLPCNSSDDCVKFFETFKFVITPDGSLCEDYTARDYWLAIKAWYTVPMLYGAGNYKKHLIPGSFIDLLSNDYISPFFKTAYQASSDAVNYYKKYQLWRHEDTVETFYWQCQLCQLLQKKKQKQNLIKLSSFWDPKEQCGKKLKQYQLMHSQFVRTGVLKG